MPYSNYILHMGTDRQTHVHEATVVMLTHFQERSENIQNLPESDAEATRDGRYVPKHFGV